MRISLVALALSCIPVATASAGVIVVDPANGPGTNFTSLAFAIQAAASGDVLLLRSGTYDGSFSAGGKTLSFIADEGAQVHITNSAPGTFATSALQVGSSAGGPAVVRGLMLSTPVDGGVPLRVIGTSAPTGHVFIEECTVPSSGTWGMWLANDGPTTVSRCTVNGSDGDPAPGPDGSPIAVGFPAVLGGEGPIAVFGGTLLGGAGLDAGLYGPGPVQVPFDGQEGAPGLQSQDDGSTVRVISGTTCIGGPGGNGAAPGGMCLPPGDGGDGVLVVSGANVHVVGLLGLGGPGGVAAPGCGANGVQGELLAAVPPGELPTGLPGTAASVVVSRVAREDEAATVTVQDAAGDTVALLVGFAPQFTYLPGLSGVQVVSPSLVIDTGPIPPSGSLSFDVRVPELGSGVQSMLAFIQPVSLDSRGHKVLGSPSALLMLDRRFKQPAFHGALYPGLAHGVGDGPESVAIGDLNGDGRADLVTANQLANSVSVLLGDGTGGAAPQVEHAAGGGAFSVAISDLDGDGHPDVVTANLLANSVSVLLGDGTGSFAPQVSYATGNPPYSLAIGDLNGDGHDDVVTANYAANTVNVLLGDGAGGLLPFVQHGTGLGPIDVSIGDMNGDRHLDLVTANLDADTVSVLRGDGSGDFLPHLQYATGNAPNSVALGDLDGDGHPDVVTANFYSFLGGGVSVLLGDGTGGLLPQVPHATVLRPQSVAIDDLNGDGHPDVVTANGDGNTVSVLLGDGTGNLPSHVEAVTPIPGSVAIGDWDSDGHPDLVTTTYTADAVSVLTGDGTGYFPSTPQYATGSLPSSAAIGDLNADGHADLVTTNTSADTVSVLLGDGTGAFATQLPYATGDGPRSVALGDLDGDGYPDVVMANQFSTTVSVLLGDGSGGLSSPTLFGIGSGNPYAVAIGDLNGDGDPDIVTTNFTTQKVSVLPGDGTGSFAAPVQFATGALAISVAIGDLNGDSHLDIVTGNVNATTVGVLLGDGAGGFAAPVQHATGAGVTSSYSVATGDLNGDFHPDLVTANSTGDTVSVLLGDGTGAFVSQVPSGTGDNPSFVAIGDLDGDGHPDLVTSNGDANTVSVLLGDGTGAFASHVQYAAGKSPYTVSIGDVDGDGHLDLVTANGNADTVSVLLNQLP